MKTIKIKKPILTILKINKIKINFIELYII